MKFKTSKRFPLYFGIVISLCIILNVMMLSKVQGFQGSAGRQVPLLDNLGTHHHQIMTHSSQAQEYFDQGLIFVFGFNHQEAFRSFQKATKLDPDCAMPA